MPSFNNHSYIQTAIDSVIKQNYANWELILIDDGSIPPLKETIIFFDDTRIKLYRNEINKGVAPSLNLGLSFCRGKYIARFDSDDIFLPNRLNFQVKFMEDNLEVGVLGCAAIAFNENEERIIGTEYNGIDLKKYLMLRNFLIHPTVIIRSKIVQNYGVIYKASMVNAEDYEFWVQLSKYTKIANLPEVVIKYRVHERSQSVLGKMDQLRLSLEVQKGVLIENRFRLADARAKGLGLSPIGMDSLLPRDY
jgi:glycosyltransferase involved in cell wall biosynthesis